MKGQFKDEFVTAGGVPLSEVLRFLLFQSIYAFQHLDPFNLARLIPESCNLSISSNRSTLIRWGAGSIRVSSLLERFSNLNTCSLLLLLQVLM